MKTIRVVLQALPEPANTVLVRATEASKDRLGIRIATLPFKAPGEWFESFMARWRSNDEFLKLDEEACRTFGQQLLTAIEPSGLGYLIENARLGNEPLRIALQVEDPRLFDVPFELMHDGNAFVTASVMVIRVLPGAGGAQAAFRPLNRMLVLMAEPTGAMWGRDAHLKEMLEQFQKIPGLKVDVVSPATPTALQRTLNAASDSGEPFDAAYIVAHGVSQAGKNASLLLEDDVGGQASVSADVLGQYFRRNPGCFVFLGTCESATVAYNSAHSGLAQQLIGTGRAGAVLAMQRPVLVAEVKRCGQTFIDRIANGALAEEAAREARVHPSLQHFSAVPVFYSQLQGPEQERAARAANLLGVDSESRFLEVYLPHFKMGLLAAVYEEAEKSSKPVPVAEEKQYHYRGNTVAETDLRAALEFIKLFQLAASTEGEPCKIRFKDAEEFGKSNWATHILLVGSRSQKKLSKILETYSEDFRFNYSDGDEWTITDQRTGKKYAVAAPSRPNPDLSQDYAIIEKIIGEPTYFIIAGLQDVGTASAAKHFEDNWEYLQKKHGAAPFQILLEYGDLGVLGKPVVDRRPAPKS